MEQNAKQLLKRISEKVSTLTDKQNSQVAHAPKENEWRAYIWQSKPHWEDIAWRVKEPNAKGETEVHLGFYSAKPSEELAQSIARAEELAKGKVSHVIKNENGIRLVWKVNLNDVSSLDKLFEQINNLLSSFLDIAFESMIKSSPNTEEPSDNNISKDAWTFENKETREEFLHWLREFEMPFDHFDYVKAYKAIYANRDDLFWGELDGWDVDYFESILREEGQVLGEYLMSQISESEMDRLYDESEWDRDWQGLLHQRIEATSWGSEKGGTPSSPYFIDGWESSEQQRLVFELFIRSNKRFFENTNGVKSETQSDPYLSFINQSSDFLLPEKFKVYITSDYFKELLNFGIKYLCFSFTNGNVSIESNNGSDYFELVYDIQNNCMLPITSKYISEDYLNDSDYIYKIYTNSWHSGLDDFHTEFGEYTSWVDFSALGFGWSIILEDEEYRVKGEIADKLFSDIQQCINSKTLYHFLSEILEQLEEK